MRTSVLMALGACVLGATDISAQQATMPGDTALVVAVPAPADSIVRPVPPPAIAPREPAQR